MTFAELAVNWLEVVIRPNRAAGTYGDHERNLRLHLLPGIGNRTVQSLNLQLLQAHFAALTESGPAMVNHVRATVRAVLNYALKSRLISYNPAEHLSLPRVELPEVTILQPSGARLLLDDLRKGLENWRLDDPEVNRLGYYPWAAPLMWL